MVIILMHVREALTIVILNLGTAVRCLLISILITMLANKHNFF